MPVILLIFSFILLHSCVSTPQQSLDAWVAELPSDQSVSFRIDNDSTLTLARYDQLVRSTIHEHIPYTLNGDTLILHEITAHDEVWQLQYNADSTILTVVSTPDTVIFHRGNMPADAQPAPLDPPSATVSTLSNGTTTVNWMSALPDPVPLTRVTLPGVQNMLELLPDRFSREDLIALRRAQGKDANANHALAVWVNRGYIELDSSTMEYVKTRAYKDKHSCR